MKDTAIALIRVCRRIGCFPFAMFVSIAAWGATTQMFPRVTYGLSAISKIGLTPIVLRTGLAACAFVIAGVLMAPGRGRRVCFVFFGLALLFSGGGVEVLSSARPDAADPMLWAAAYSGITIGSLVGLWAALELQSPRSQRPHKSPDTHAIEGQQNPSE